MGLLTGFTTIIAIICCGIALAHTAVLDVRSQRTLGEIAFFVASPALMLTTISRIELAGATRNFIASGLSLAVCFVAFALVAGLLWRQEPGEVLIGSLCASYVNAGNLGLAISAYVVGDITVVVPTLLVQILLVQPVALMVLDHLRGGGTSVTAVLRRLLTNPLTIAAVLGLVLATTGWRLPQPVLDPLEVMAGAAIPLMLLSYGAALRLSPLPGRAGHNREVALVAVLKLAVMPLVALGLGLALDLHETVLLGVVLTAALPTAQNIFLHATRYRVGEDVARESILLTTLFSLPVALAVALLLG